MAQYASLRAYSRSPMRFAHDPAAAARRAIESIESLVRIHTAQEDDIYDMIVTG